LSWRIDVTDGSTCATICGMFAQASAPATAVVVPDGAGDVAEDAAPAGDGEAAFGDAFEPDPQAATRRAPTAMRAVDRRTRTTIGLSSDGFGPCQHPPRCGPVVSTLVR
jgi:hypothetical protein